MPEATPCLEPELVDPAGIPPLGMWEERQDYFGRHWRLHQARGKAKNHDCASCAEDGIRKRALDWAQVHGETGDDPWTDYLPLCRSCHIRYDKSGHRMPHTEEAKANMGEAVRRGYVDGTRIGQNTHQSGKTCCPQKHEYTPENTYIDKRGYRYCIPCMRERTRQWQAVQQGQSCSRQAR